MTKFAQPVACTINILQLWIAPLELLVSDATIWIITLELLVMILEASFSLIHNYITSII